MAPFLGPGKQSVFHEIAEHREGPLNITLGRYQPQFVIRFENSHYELRPLLLDRAGAEQAARERKNDRFHTPEIDWEFLRPGDPIIMHQDRVSFMSRLESWPGWAYMEDR